MCCSRWVRITSKHVCATALFARLFGCGTGGPSTAVDAGTTEDTGFVMTGTSGELQTNATTTPGGEPSSTHDSATTTAGQAATSNVEGPASLATESNTGFDASSSSAPEITDDESTEPETDAGEDPSPSSSGDNSDEPESSDDSSETSPPQDCEPIANEHALVGYGNDTTGGGSSAPVSVGSFNEAVEVLDNYRDAFEQGTQNALVVRYTGSFDFGTITDVCAQHTKEAQILYIKEVENVTFEGAPGSSANFGIKVNRAKNVIVRNMTIGLLPGGGESDAITIEGNGTNGDVEHVWIDHNDLFSSTKDDCDGAGDTEFDGLIDIKKGARYITISYNKLHDHQKTGLLGSSDTDDVDRFVTFHHNWYENVVSRTPLHRFGYAHLFNNYYNRILDSGINVRMGGVALIEANYFENAANPVTSRYSDEPGFWDLRDNHVGENVTWSVTEDTLANADDWTSTATFPAEQLTYAYEPDRSECVRSIVMARAGATLD